MSFCEAVSRPRHIFLFITAGLCCCRPKKIGDSSSAAITFADVAGVETAREELLEVVACLRDARRYSRLNAKTPSGVLLCGPPGTGKTLLGDAYSSLCQPLSVFSWKTLLLKRATHICPGL